MDGYDLCLLRAFLLLNMLFEYFLSLTQNQEKENILKVRGYKLFII